MADGGMIGAYPQVFVVDTQAPRGPLPVPVYPRRGGWRHRLLFALVGLALLGVLIEACCIYNLHRGHGETSLAEKIISNEITEIKPERKPAVLLKGSRSPERKDNVLLWTQEGDGFRHQMDYKDGLLTVREEGYYFLYSKVAISDIHCILVKHTIMRISERYGDGKTPMELMQSVRYHCPKPLKGDKQETQDVTSSYLGGAFHLFTNDSVFVKLEGGQIRTGLKENFFGAFLL
ncbi:tumor necrosis factor ligand superfamily member 14-like [Alosa sapidissima]|uniref:tumor necrosis factor ligand superfamily member 14-like n=1 Tax=Alosa sapidissima TaxID=34773 RepID=UPI001C09ED17|nr:tumor necrosis factor ligand superfamily member 14-like [Alosa sapidissima]